MSDIQRRKYLLKALKYLVNTAYFGFVYGLLYWLYFFVGFEEAVLFGLAIIISEHFDLKGRSENG